MALTQTARKFEAELASLREELLLMAGRVEEMIHRAGRALVERDIKLAHETMALDRAVNRAEVEIDERCLVILARHQPLASDLRFVTLAMKMVTDLERIADLAVNICERAIDLSRADRIVVHADIPVMTRLVQEQVAGSIDAFVNGDSSKAWEVLDNDDEVDDLYHRVFEDSLERMRLAPDKVHQLIHIQSVAKWLERMGDHSTNLAELVIFMLEGRDIRHPEHQSAKIAGNKIASE
ncbi:MAG: phosphate signaling complex protein PhoU [Myxococcota bacterium]